MRLDIICREHGDDLDCEVTPNGDIKVTPCQKCLAKSYECGQEDERLNINEFEVGDRVRKAKKVQATNV